MAFLKSKISKKIAKIAIGGIGIFVILFFVFYEYLAHLGQIADKNLPPSMDQMCQLLAETNNGIANNPHCIQDSSGNWIYTKSIQPAPAFNSTNYVEKGGVWYYIPSKNSSTNQ